MSQVIKRLKIPMPRAPSPEYPSKVESHLNRRTFFAMLGAGAAAVAIGNACGSRRQEPLPGTPPQPAMNDAPLEDVSVPGVDTAEQTPETELPRDTSVEPDLAREPVVPTEEGSTQTQSAIKPNSIVNFLPLSGITSIQWSKKQKFSFNVEISHNSESFKKYLIDNSYDVDNEIQRLIKRQFSFHSLQENKTVEKARKKIEGLLRRIYKKHEGEEPGVFEVILHPKRFEIEEPLLGMYAL